jgi:hypothetical protein
MKRKMSDNNGIALITVVIGVMFCLLLTSTMLRVSLLGLQSRSINQQASDNYYDAECAVDTIRLNVQNTAAKAWESTDNTSNSENFVKEAYRLLTGNEYSGDISYTESTVITSISDNISGLEGANIVGFDGIVMLKDTSTNLLNGLTIQGIEVEYTNPKTGMLSKVKTDITIHAPIYASDESFPAGRYSMFAGTGAILFPYSDVDRMSYVEQTGNVYVGYGPRTNPQNHDSYKKTYYNPDDALHGEEADAIYIEHDETMIFSGDNVLINGNVYLIDCSNLQVTGKTVEIRGKIYLGNNCHLIINPGTTIKCRDVVKCTSDSGVKANGSGESLAAGSFTNPGGTFTGEPRVDSTYRSKEASIVCLGNWNESTKRWTYAENAVIAITDGEVEVKMPLGNTKCSITADLEDARLKPKRNYISPDTGRSYDQVFCSIFDIEYFEKFCIMNAGMNGNIACKLDEYTLEGSKFIPGSYAAKDSGRYFGLEIPRSEDDENPEEHTVDVLMTWGDINNPVNIGDVMFMVSPNHLLVNMDSQHAHYTGIFFTPGYLHIKCDGGNNCYGQSLLDLMDINKSYEKAALVNFINQLGLHSYYDGSWSLQEGEDWSTGSRKMRGKMLALGDYPGPQFVDSDGIALSDEYRQRFLVINNLFKNGIKIFYEDDGISYGGSGSSSKVDKAYNGKLDLTEIENYDKR